MGMDDDDKEARADFYAAMNGHRRDKKEKEPEAKEKQAVKPKPLNSGGRHPVEQG